MECYFQSDRLLMTTAMIFMAEILPADLRYWRPTTWSSTTLKKQQKIQRPKLYKKLAWMIIIIAPISDRNSFILYVSSW